MTKYTFTHDGKTWVFDSMTAAMLAGLLLDNMPEITLVTEKGESRK